MSGEFFFYDEKRKTSIHLKLLIRALWRVVRVVSVFDEFPDIVINTSEYKINFGISPDHGAYFHILDENDNLIRKVESEIIEELIAEMEDC